MKVFHQQPSLDTLSSRELEVLRLMGLYYGTTRIAQTLGVSPKAVETYQARLRAKLKLPTVRDVRHFSVFNFLAGDIRAPEAKE